MEGGVRREAAKFSWEPFIVQRFVHFNTGVATRPHIRKSSPRSLVYESLVLHQVSEYDYLRIIRTVTELHLVARGQRDYGAFVSERAECALPHNNERDYYGHC
jgi:hypothetical protein